VRDREIDEVLNKDAGSAQAPKPETLRSVADLIKSSLRPVRPLPPRWALTGGLVLVCVAVALGGAVRAGFLGIEKMDSLERALIFSLLGVFAWASASEFVNSMIPGSQRRLPSGALLGLGIAALLGVFALLFRDYQTDHFLSAGVACLLAGLLHAVPTGLLSWLLLRRGFAVNPVSAGLAAGTLAGLSGLGMLELHCSNFQAAHVLVWHTAVVPLSGAAGALAGWVMRRIRLAAYEGAAGKRADS
jgi:hypothetical protein